MRDDRYLGAQAAAAATASTAAAVEETRDAAARSRTEVLDADMVGLGEHPAFDWTALRGAIVDVHVASATFVLEHLTDLAAAGGLNEAETAGLASLLSVDVADANAIVSAPTL